MISRLGLLIAAISLVCGCAASQPPSQTAVPSPSFALRLPGDSVDFGEPIGGPPWTVAQRDQCNEHFTEQNGGWVWDLLHDYGNPLTPPVDPVMLPVRGKVAEDAGVISQYERPDVIPEASWNNLHDAAGRAASVFAQPMTPQSFHDEYVLLIAPLQDVIHRCETVVTWVENNVPQ